MGSASSREDPGRRRGVGQRGGGERINTQIVCSLSNPACSCAPDLTVPTFTFRPFLIM